MDKQRISQEFEKKREKKLVMPVVRTLKEDALDSPEKFGALINFYGVLLRKLIRYNTKGLLISYTLVV